MQVYTGCMLTEALKLLDTSKLNPRTGSDGQSVIADHAAWRTAWKSSRTTESSWPWSRAAEAALCLSPNAGRDWQQNHVA